MNDISHKSFSTVTLFVLCLLAIANIAVIDFIFFRLQEKISFLEAKSQQSVENNSLTESTSVSVLDNACPVACTTEIYQATSSLKLSQTNTSQPTSKVLVDTSSVKEYFITLGTGSVSSDEWTDISGIQAAIDSTLYKSIKKVTFEASLEIPTGNGTGYVRLYNVTDKHPVWYSEMILEGQTGKLLTSNPITLDKGSKTYQVQMKNSLRSTTILNQARVHIQIN